MSDLVFCDPGLPEFRPHAGHATFCRKCGSHTDIVTRQEGFESSSGRPDIRYRTVCPNRRHWWDGHHRSVWLFATYESRPPHD